MGVRNDDDDDGNDRWLTPEASICILMFILRDGWPLQSGCDEIYDSIAQGRRSMNMDDRYLASGKEVERGCLLFRGARVAKLRADPCLAFILPDSIPIGALVPMHIFVLSEAFMDGPGYLAARRTIWCPKMELNPETHGYGQPFDPIAET
jgi:hypothetical protein